MYTLAYTLLPASAGLLLPLGRRRRRFKSVGDCTACKPRSERTGGGGGGGRATLPEGGKYLRRVLLGAKFFSLLCATYFRYSGVELGTARLRGFVTGLRRTENRTESERDGLRGLKQRTERVWLQGPCRKSSCTGLRLKARGCEQHEQAGPPACCGP